eukprot:m.153532 g.153532  ORF g.153532 m.153532 type:complete len:100 (-) comp24593_c0_seq4:92-391(-)
MSVDGPVRALVPEVQSENATSLLRDHFMFALEERFKFFSSASHFNMISKLVRVTLGANTENIRQTIQNEFRSAGMLLCEKFFWQMNGVCMHVMYVRVCV